ncbi:MAG TPA: ABC transporter substrate-binding protein [Candidatus Saccharimonadales bacterium]|nr:ABC transporter substrate-binding protein [Candidatus Saccharimonadales bacterium]
MENQEPEIIVQQPLEHSSVPDSNKKFSWILPIVVISITVLILLLGFGYFLMIKSKPAIEKTGTLYTGKILIGYTIWPGYLGLYIARDKGFFKDAGLDVSLKKFEGFSALHQAFKDKQLQGQATLTYDAVDEIYNHIDQKVITAVDYSNGSDGIIAGSNITTLSQAKGKRFGFEQGTMEEFFTRTALEQYQLQVSDIVPVNLDAGAAADALEKGKVDIATTFEPYMTKTVEKTKGHILFTSADAPGAITDILTFYSDFTKRYPTTVQAIVVAYFRGITFWKEHPEEANAIIAKELAVSPEEAKKELKGISVLDLNGNIAALTFSPGLNSVYGNMRQISRLIAQQKHTNAIDTDTLINPVFVHELQQ